MGTWGAGLYANDFAADLKSTLRAVAKLPVDAETLVELVRKSMEPDAETETTFWLVLADQLRALGVDSAPARERALAIIDSGTDLLALARREGNPRLVESRRRHLEELRARLQEAPRPRERKTLKTPQPLLMDVGDVMLFPTCRGEATNPYLSAELRRGWKADGWKAFLVTEARQAFGYLAWYRPLVCEEQFSTEPTLDEVLTAPGWVLRPAGTVSGPHFKRLALKKLGSARVSRERVEQAFPGRAHGESAAVQDISLANALMPRVGIRGQKLPAIDSVGSLLETP